MHFGTVEIQWKRLCHTTSSLLNRNSNYQIRLTFIQLNVAKIGFKRKSISLFRVSDSCRLSTRGKPCAYIFNWISSLEGGKRCSKHANGISCHQMKKYRWNGCSTTPKTMTSGKNRKRSISFQIYDI